MEPDEPKKNVSKSVSLPPDMWDRVEARASAHYGGNRSSYMRMLVERDEKGMTQRQTSISATILQDLAALYLPTRAAQLGDELMRPAKANPAAAIRQPVVIEQFLAALLRALSEPGFEPELPFDLADKARIARWDSESATRQADLARALAQHLRPGGLYTIPEEDPGLHLVAEPTAEHGAKAKRHRPPPSPGKTG